MLWCSGLWTNWATASPSSGILPYRPLVMKMICAPSQVMREGRDLNQHGQAGRQEQASSSSPVIFHEVLLAAAAALPGMPNALMPHAIATETIDLLISFITFFLSLKRCHLLGRMYSCDRTGQYRKRRRQSQADAYGKISFSPYRNKSHKFFGRCSGTGLPPVRFKTFQRCLSEKLTGGTPVPRPRRH